MNLHELSIRRHVLAYMMSAVLVLFGMISYNRIGVDRVPNIDIPVISVTTAMPGADPGIIDSSITNVIETAVNSTPGIDHIQSSSSPGVSVVNINFDLSKDIDIAFNEVQSKINQVRRQLPDEADPPIVDKVEVGAFPIMWLALRGDRTLQQLNQYASNVIKKRLETINGVGQVLIGGRRERTIRVNLDPQAMAGYGIAAQDLVRAFEAQHVRFPGGFLTGQTREDLIKLDLEYHEVEELRDMIVAYRDGAPVRLSEIGTVVDGLADYREVARFNGEPTVGLGIVKISGSNTVAIADAVRQRVKEEIRPQLPPGLTITEAHDQSELIKEIIAGLEEHLLLGTLLAALVVYLFLRSFRSTLIIATAIPVSLLGAVAIMYFFGYTFNQLTMLALLLLIGVVVDDAIVVLENIYRHREKIEPDRVTAAINGTDEVVFAVVAASLTLVSIFTPVIFMGGIIGRFFESFAVVVTSGILVSLFVSLTLTPMLCSRFLGVYEKHGRVHRALERALDALDNAYRRALGAVLRFRWTVIGIATVTVLLSVFVFNATGKTFAPPQDEGRFMVTFKTPLGSSVQYTNAKLRQIEEILGSYDAIRSYFTAIGQGQEGQVNQGISFVRMVPRDQREISQQELMPKLREDFRELAGVRAFPTQTSLVGGQRGEPLQFFISGPELQRVGQLTEEIQRRLSGTEGMGYVDTNLQLDLPQLEVKVDRTRAADLGITPSQVGQAMSILAGGRDIARFNEVPGDGTRYDIRLKAKQDTYNSPGDLDQIYLRANGGELVRLDSVVSLKETLGPAAISRFDLQYASKFFIDPDMPMGAALSKVREVTDDVLPLGYRFQLTGQAESFQETIQYISFAFVVAILLVFMVLASQFNSFVQPLIVMVAQPLAIIGGIFGLWISGHTLNAYSMIGMLLLMGLVAKNSILLVDLTNQRRDDGMAIDDALRDACPIRLRPVLMTSLTVVLALLPAAIGVGAGAETNAPLAVAVIAGMISSTGLTLIVVPAVYSLVEGFLESHQLGRESVRGPETG